MVPFLKLLDSTLHSLNDPALSTTGASVSREDRSMLGPPSRTAVPAQCLVEQRGRNRQTRRINTRQLKAAPEARQDPWLCG